MSDRIRVRLKKKTAGIYKIIWTDPETGNERTKSTGLKNKRKAEDLARDLEHDLNSNQLAAGGEMAWEAFAQLWEDEKPTRRLATAINYRATINKVRKLGSFKKVGDLTTGKIAKFEADLRKMNATRAGEGSGKVATLSESSVARHLRTIKMLARWAHDRGLLAKLPKVKIPATRKAKGRPLTGEEFDRMLAAAPKIVGEENADGWRFMLGAMYWGGLRLGEALYLRWDHAAYSPRLILDGKRSAIEFDHDAQKNGEEVTCRLMREAVELVEDHVGRGDEGFVFDLPGCTRLLTEVGKKDAVDWASRRISKMGKAAGIITRPKKGGTATAHDLRRSFGYRWARKVMPATLKQLMRHASIATTMTYYDHDLDDATASHLWEMADESQSGDGFGDGSSPPVAPSAENTIIQARARSSAG